MMVPVILNHACGGRPSSNQNRHKRLRAVESRMYRRNPTRSFSKAKGLVITRREHVHSTMARFPLAFLPKTSNRW